MKTLLFFLLACTASFAQEFKATPTGLVSKKDSNTNYIVASFDSIPADTLYANAKKYILSKYSGIKNPIVTDEKGSFLRFETGDQVMSTLKKKNTEVKYLGSATGVLEFKDGKVKIYYGDVTVSTLDSNEVKKELPLKDYWNKKGKVVENETKTIAEGHFNASTRLLIEALGTNNTKTASSDW